MNRRGLDVYSLIIRVLIGFRLSIIGVHKIAGTHLALTLAYAMRVQCVSLQIRARVTARATKK